MNNTDHYTLAIESAVGGGSLSVIRNETEAAGWSGPDGISKAENLLINIEAVLEASRIKLGDLGAIAVSAGPGSFTGIKIGVATAKGLVAGLGVPLLSCSALEAVAASVPAESRTAVVIPMGRNTLCLQRFAGMEATTEPETFPAEELPKLLSGDLATRFILYPSIFQPFAGVSNAIEMPIRLSHAVGLFCKKAPGLIEPIFISKGF